MAKNSSIEWTESTWNPITGCSKISSGCENCYAERMAKRLQAMGQPNYRNGFKVTTHTNAVELPLKWKKHQRIFVNSMSDIFHESVQKVFILKVMSHAEYDQDKWKQECGCYEPPPKSAALRLKTFTTRPVKRKRGER